MEKNLRCAISGKITQGHEVVLLEYAIDYVRKQGFYVTPWRIK